LQKASFQVVSLRRREFITLIGGAAAMWPLAADGQKAERMRRLGVLMAASEDDPLMQTRITAFRQALAELGWTEGRNLKIEWRWTGGDITRVREYASELVRLAPDVLVANGTPNIAALKQATNSIPIVFVVVNDPVAQGIIASMAHPGGNITGFSFLEYSMVGKSLEMLKQIAPGIVRVAMMFNPDTYPYYAIHLQSFETVARTLSLELTAAQVQVRRKSTKLSRSSDGSRAARSSSPPILTWSFIATRSSGPPGSTAFPRPTRSGSTFRKAA
jgi:putative ABC transport system substrate-binding protein